MAQSQNVCLLMNGTGADDVCPLALKQHDGFMQVKKQLVHGSR